jgi:nucleoside phosphorylase
MTFLPLFQGSVRAILDEFRPRFVAMTGICAGYKNKVALGDLVAAAYAFHTEEGKVETDEQGQDRLRPESRTHNTARRVVQYVNNFTAWEDPVVEMKQRMIGRELREEEYPKCLIAPVASSMAVHGNNPFPRLLEHNRKALFLDQEVAAFYQTLSEVPDMYFLAVKGVCDYGDENKNDAYHEYAARASAIYILYFMQDYVTSITMPR